MKNAGNLRIVSIDIWTTIHCFTLTFCMEVYTHKGSRMTKRCLVELQMGTLGLKKAPKRAQ